MKKGLFLVIMIAVSMLGYSEDSPFFLSSEKILQEKQASLKELNAFTFFPLLKIEEKNASKTIELIDQELNKVGLVVKAPVLTPEGADLDSFSSPTLQFTIEQLVDQNNNPLPVLQAVLSVNDVVELGNAKAFTSLNTNRWSVYLKKTNNVQQVIKQALPQLLNEFMLDFRRGNAASQKPTFYISYDASWWQAP